MARVEWQIRVERLANLKRRVHIMPLGRMEYNQRQRFWQLEFVNQRLRASRLPMLWHLTDLPLNKENAHVFSYPRLTHWNSTQGQLPRTLDRPIAGDVSFCLWRTCNLCRAAYRFETDGSRSPSKETEPNWVVGTYHMTSWCTVSVKSLGTEEKIRYFIPVLKLM